MKVLPGQDANKPHDWITSGLLTLALVVCSFAVAPAHAVLIKSYDFSGDLSDSLGNGVDLVASGGALGSGRYTFGANQGLRLTSALPNPNDYTIEIKFEMDSAAPYGKKCSITRI